MSTEKQRIQFRQRARRQHGVVSLDQAREAGMSRQAVARRVAAKAWFPMGPSVYLLAEHEETPRARAIAAVLSLGSDATLEAGSAAYWWRLRDTAPAPVQIAVPPSRHPRPRRGVVTRRRRIAAADRTTVGGVAVTTRALTALDVAARLGLDDGARVADRALLDGVLSLAALRDTHARTAGRDGAVVGGELIALAAGGARSEAERRAHRLLTGAGIGGWGANLAIRLPGYGVAVGDLVFEAERVVAEVDGWAYHRELRAFLRDGPRQSALAAADWIVLRTHWYELRDDPLAFLTRLRAVLTSRSAMVARSFR